MLRFDSEDDPVFWCEIEVPLHSVAQGLAIEGKVDTSEIEYPIGKAKIDSTAPGTRYRECEPISEQESTSDDKRIFKKNAPLKMVTKVNNDSAFEAVWSAPLSMELIEDKEVVEKLLAEVFGEKQAREIVHAEEPQADVMTVKVEDGVLSFETFFPMQLMLKLEEDDWLHVGALDDQEFSVAMETPSAWSGIVDGLVRSF
tara:strand:- start:1069 stop:1668 length:600 start_codon:yes stop_codon:yes gene_type:complete